MAEVGESSSSTPTKAIDEKPVIVRVKRKAFQSRLDAFWLEINERPLKRPLLDFGKLSISESSEKEELKSKKVLVQHLETVSSSEEIIHIVQSFVSDSADASVSKTKSEERKYTFKKENKHGQLLSKARQTQEVFAKNARFEQIWRSRKGNNERVHGKELHDMCHFFDVVRVDVDEHSEEPSLEDQKLLSSYLPLLKEFIPNAAVDIEYDMHTYRSKQVSSEEYVYDYYTMKEDIDMPVEDTIYPFPLVQVEEDGFYDGPDDPLYETDDSNAEDNPLNDYPDEITDDEEDEAETEASDNESEKLEESQSESRSSSEADDLVRDGLSEYEEQMYDDENGYSDDAFDYVDDCEDEDFR